MKAHLLVLVLFGAPLLAFAEAPLPLANDGRAGSKVQSVSSSDGATAPATGWGDFGFGWRGRDGSPSDGVKIGRQALAGSAATGLLSGLGWSWGYDAGVRLAEAVPCSGDLEGRGPPAETAAERFTFLYGEGDELLERAREATGEIDLYTAGP